MSIASMPHMNIDKINVQHECIIIGNWHRTFCWINDMGQTIWIHQSKEKKEEICPMTDASTPTEIPNKQSDNTKRNQKLPSRNDWGPA